MKCKNCKNPKLNKVFRFKRNKNSIELIIKEIVKKYKSKKSNFFKNKNFHNLSSVKHIINNKEIINIMK